MKRVLFLTFFISLSLLVCKGQEYLDISYEEVESCCAKLLAGNFVVGKRTKH